MVELAMIGSRVDYVVAKGISIEKALNLREALIEYNEETDGRYFAELGIEQVVLR